MIATAVRRAIGAACVIACGLACSSPRETAAVQAPAKAPAPALAAPPHVHKPAASAERTASGLVHELLTAAHVGERGSERAEPHDRVRVAYTGFDAQGRVIDSSKGRGAFAELAADEGFPGLREALQLLRAGEKRRFFIPEELAYKHYPGNVRGDLVYEIELLGIVQMPAPPEVPDDLTAPPRRSREDFASRVLDPGTGTKRPRGETSGVDVHYTCWNATGQRLFSTVPQGQPFRGELNKLDLMPGMALAVRRMVVGERRRLWLPPELTSHNPAAGRAEALVCDVELLRLYEKKELVESSTPAAR